MQNLIIMDKLDKQLAELSKIEPSKSFIESSKKRLIQQIQLEKNESYFQSFLKRIKKVNPSAQFVKKARWRLMYQISHKAELKMHASLRGFALFLSYTKKILASTMVMLIAVTATLFFVEGNRPVEASNHSYLELKTGNASIKRADLITWEDIKNTIEVQEGDVIKVGEDSQLVVHFFDDTELRLSENSLILISQLNISSGFDRQGVIEVSLHEGEAWAQILNIDDGYAKFTMHTPQAIFESVNGSIDLKVNNEKTLAYIFDNEFDLTSLEDETRNPVENKRVFAEQKIEIQKGSIHPLILTTELIQQDKANDWIQSNLEQNHKHLITLRENGLNRLNQMAGTLPGQMLYPIKQAKERLRLAFSGSKTDVQVEIANSRLNEAIVLFESGEQQKGQEALMAYQSIARQIAEEKNKEDAEILTNKIIIPHQKILRAKLPNNLSEGLVKDALHQTSEILAKNPIDLERIRLNNSLERLEDVKKFLKDDNYELAKDRLTAYQLAVNNDLFSVDIKNDTQEKEEALKEVLSLKQEELKLLSELTGQFSKKKEDTRNDKEDRLFSMIQSASKVAENDFEMTISFVKPILPEWSDSVLSENKIDSVSKILKKEAKVLSIIDKIHIYKSWEGQKNQIQRLLKNDLENPKRIDYLMGVKENLNGRARDYLSVRILQLKRKSELQKHKAMKRKIERSKRLRQAKMKEEGTIGA